MLTEGNCQRIDKAHTNTVTLSLLLLSFSFFLYASKSELCLPNRSTRLKLDLTEISVSIQWASCLSIMQWRVIWVSSNYAHTFNQKKKNHWDIVGRLQILPQLILPPYTESPLYKFAYFEVFDCRNKFNFVRKLIFPNSNPINRQTGLRDPPLPAPRSTHSFSNNEVQDSAMEEWHVTPIFGEITVSRERGKEAAGGEPSRSCIQPPSLATCAHSPGHRGRPGGTEILVNKYSSPLSTNFPTNATVGKIKILKGHPSISSLDRVTFKSKVTELGAQGCTSIVLVCLFWGFDCRNKII